MKAAAPGIHLHGFSPLEITVGATTLGLSLERYLAMLREAGLDSIPGTAAEILDTRVRPKITPQKLSADDWIDLMRTAHRAGLRSTTTIMFGHIDDPSAWAMHLLRLARPAGARPAASRSSSRCRSSTTGRRCSCGAARGPARRGASA